MQEWINQWGAIAGGAIAILTFVSLLGGVFWRAWKKLTHLAEMGNRIYKELTPNGGSSLRDAIDDIRQQQHVAAQRQRSLMSLMDTPMFESDAKGICVWTNRAYLRFFDVSSDQILGNGWVNVIYADDRDKVYASWQQAVNQQREFQMEYRVVCSEGIINKVVCETVCMRGVKGEMVGYVGSLAVLTGGKA